jgi:uncharacterized protein
MTSPFAYEVGDFADDGRRGLSHAEGDHGEPRNGHATTVLSPDAEAFMWLLDTFTSTTAGVLGAVAVSSDGLLVAVSSIDNRANADRLAAVVSGMASLATGAAHGYALGLLNRVVVDMSEGYLLISALGSGSVLGVVAERSTDVATAAYEMTLFATRAGSRLTPALILELRAAILN